MRTRIPALLLVLVALAAGCGNRRLLLGVDALSFTAPADREYAFGPVPPLPVPIETGEVPVLDDMKVNLFGSAQKIVSVDAVTITFSASASDSTGDGLDTLRVYLSGPDSDPMSTPPVITAPFVLQPGQTVPVHAVVSGDPRVNALFTQNSMRVTVTTSFAGPASGSPLNGRLSLTELKADVIARHGSL